MARMPGRYKMINFLDENLDFFMILAAVATILAGLCFPSLLN